MSDDSNESDVAFMRRALCLAMNGRGLVEPNPMVGCVLVKHGRVIGEGYHARFGHPHAEPAALASCTESPAGATAYVTLEPCSHTSKKTPPCAPRLIDAKIARVVIGCLDPNPLVNGNGVAMLKAAGIKVDGPVLEAQARQLIAPFLAGCAGRSPYVTLKWAESADGKVAGANGQRVQISNSRSSRMVQELRARCDGIVVGIGTVLNDNPALLPRDVAMIRPYRRMVLDSQLRLPINSNLVTTVNQGPVIVYTTRQAGAAKPQHKRALQNAGVEVEGDIGWDETGRLSLREWFQKISRLDLTHLLVEPGPTLARNMLPLVPRLWVIQSPKRMDAVDAPDAPAIPSDFISTGQIDLDGDVLMEYLNRNHPNFFAATPSADFMLAGGR